MNRRTHWAALCALLLAFQGCDDGGGPDDTTDGGGRTDGGDADDGGGPGDGGDQPDGPVIIECGDDTECPADRYCVFEGEAFVGTCVPGCRLDRADPQSSCMDGEKCVEEEEGGRRTCVRDPSCEVDDDCEPQEYCGADECAVGCRIYEDKADDQCSSTDEGRLQLCNEAHECEPAVICCTGETCDERLAADCNLVLPDRLSCNNPNPCAGRCPNGDTDCAEDQFCNDDALCETGCRPEARGVCPGEVCDPERHQCVPSVCETSEDCGPTQFCALSAPGVGECILGCRLIPEDNCPRPDSFCNEARQCAVGCTNDGQCVERLENEDAYCRRGACHLPCETNDDCPTVPVVEVCNLETLECEPGCRPDPFEENNEADEATPLMFPIDDPNHYDSGEMGFYACPDDSDFFSFTSPGVGGVVQVTVRFEQDDGDLDLRVYVPGEQAPRVAQSADDDEQIRVLNAPRGMYFVEVFGRAGVQENAFTLEVDLLDAVGCQPDEADPGDDEAEDATRLPLPGRQDSQTIDDRSYCAGDVDWYVFPMSPGDGITVTLVILGNGDPLIGDSLDFEIFGPPGVPGPQAEVLFRPNGNGVLPEEEGGHAFLSFHAPVPNPQTEQGDYYLRVVGVDDEQESVYRLIVEVDRNGDLCLPDDAEANDGRRDAFDLMEIPEFVTNGVGGGVELRPLVNLDKQVSLCTGDEDWFALELERGDTLTASVVRLDVEEVDGVEVVEGDSIIEIHDADGVVGNPGRNRNALNSAIFQDALPGEYWVRVAVPVPEIRFNYVLRLFRDPGLGDCPRDRFDQQRNNGARENATPVSPGEDYGALTLCGADGDVDWYCFDVDAVAAVTVSIDSPPGGPNLLLDFFDRNGAHLNENEAQGHRQGDRQEVSYNQQLPGRYCARVSTLAGNNRYTLRVEVDERDFVCEDDPDEDNDSRARSVPLPDGAFDRDAQWLCHRIPAEEDWFVLDVPAGEERIFAATFIYSDDGDLFIEAYDDDDMLLGSTLDIARGNSKQCVVIAPFNGDRLIWFRLAPLSINLILEDDERLDYGLHVLDGQDCEAVNPPSPGAMWPTLQGGD